MHSLSDGIEEIGNGMFLKRPIAISPPDCTPGGQRTDQSRTPTKMSAREFTMGRDVPLTRIERREQTIPPGSAPIVTRSTRHHATFIPQSKLVETPAKCWRMLLRQFLRKTCWTMRTKGLLMPDGRSSVEVVLAMNGLPKEGWAE